MKCPACGNPHTDVKDSRESAENGGSIRRRRSCPSCLLRFTTKELTQEQIDRLTNNTYANEAILLMNKAVDILKTPLHAAILRPDTEMGDGEPETVRAL